MEHLDKLSVTCPVIGVKLNWYALNLVAVMLEVRFPTTYVLLYDVWFSLASNFRRRHLAVTKK